MPILRLVCALLIGSATLAAQSDLPVSYVCPMSEHSEVVETRPGKCPLCQMPLVPVSIELAWSCPTHSAVIADKPGKCPLDKRDLVQVAIARYWTCGEKTTDYLAGPGTCADGKPRKMVREPRAHGDHNPKHGGQFFMAGDKWHHVEATYPRRGLLRVFLYDNFTKPLGLKEVAGRAVMREESGTSGTFREVEAAALKPSLDRKALEARIASPVLPLKVTVKLKFESNGPEERFDFTFAEYTKEPASVAPSAQAAQPRPAAAPAATTPALPPLLSGIPTSMPVPIERFSEMLPGTSVALLVLLDTRSAEVRALIEQGDFGAVYVPALVSKEVALALEVHLAELPDARRLQATNAVRRLVLAAWQLDFFGDLGNREKLTAVHVRFSGAVTDLKTAFAR